MSEYAASAVRELLARGPAEGEDFYRLKVTGNGETHWVNVTPRQLAAVASVLDETATPYELMQLVREHPDFVFGTIFTRDDFPHGVPEDFNAGVIDDLMTERGNEYIDWS